MRFLLYAATLLALVGADRALKSYTVRRFAPPAESFTATADAPVALPGGFLQLTRVHNYGAAWSSLSGKTVLLVLITALLMAAVAFVLVRRIVRHPLGVAAALLVLGGGLGNLIDRLSLGYVVDMLEITLFSYPVFNLADCFVVVGAVLGSVYYLWFYDKYDKVTRGKDDGADLHGHK